MQQEFEIEIDSQEELQQRRERQQRREQMKRDKERYLLRLNLLKAGIPVCAVLILALVFVIKGLAWGEEKIDPQSFPVTVQQSDAYKNVDSELSMRMEDEAAVPDVKVSAEEPQIDSIQAFQSGVAAEMEGAQGTLTLRGQQQYGAAEGSAQHAVDGEVVSSSVIVIDRSSEEIISQRDARAQISPASMTKILTVLVAAEHVTDLDDTFTMTREITDYGYVNDCSSAGFLEDEEVTVRDLFYGTVLPSGADAAVALAVYVAGSQEAFVDLMNEKAQELGLSQTSHFTNCVGIYDEQHYSTAYDMAMILEAAVDNELCREVLSAHVYTTTKTEQHPEGIILSNWFLRRIEDKDTHGEVVAAKTGYVVQSGSCAASYAEDKQGNGYICVTAGSTSSWRCIYDHVALYQQLLQ